jgi:hypothetical protein
MEIQHGEVALDLEARQAKPSNTCRAKSRSDGVEVWWM